MKILITGGAGFIGSNLIQFLDGYDVTIIDNLSGGRSGYGRTLLPNLVQGDLKDPNICLGVTKGVDAVIHLAAKGNVVDSIENPIDNFQNNAFATLNLLNACAKNKVKKFVMASTGGALMGNCELPVNETSIPKPISPYGASKMACEGYCHAFAHIFDIEIKILRFANVYGPYSAHKKGLVNSVMKKISNNQNLVIFGDGSATRDFIYVNDLCDGIMKALGLNKTGCEIFHLGNGDQISILELVKLIIDTSNINNLEIEYHPARKGEVEKNFSSPLKARELLDFNPSTSIRSGIEKTWSWHNKQFSNRRGAT